LWSGADAGHEATGGVAASMAASNWSADASSGALDQSGAAGVQRQGTFLGATLHECVDEAGLGVEGRKSCGYRSL